MGPSHWANARPRFLASSRSSCLWRQRETTERFCEDADQRQQNKEKRLAIQMLLLLHPAVPLSLCAQFSQSHGVTNAHLKV